MNENNDSFIINPQFNSLLFKRDPIDAIDDLDAEWSNIHKKHFEDENNPNQQESIQTKVNTITIKKNELFVYNFFFFLIENSAILRKDIIIP